MSASDTAPNAFRAAMATLPLVAILRGLTPKEAPSIGESLIAAGFRLIEVPLNSPDPLESIRTLARVAGGRAMVGAGTVITPAEVGAVAEAGGHLIISPHFDPDVVRAAKAADLVAVPGIATPSEAFAALKSGADALKIFPAEMVPPAAVKAMLAVLPKGTALLPVGGITPASIANYRAAGAAGFGLGSALYRPGDRAAAVKAAADAFVAAWRAISSAVP